HARFVAAQQEEAALAEQERRLAEMLASSRAQASDATERHQAAQGLADDVARSAGVQGELPQRLGRGQGRLGGRSARTRATEDQLKRLEAASKALDQRRTQLAFTEQRLSAFEARATELAQMSEDIDAKIAALAQRDAVVEAVRNEVAGVHDISARSKSDLDYV